MIIHPPIPKPVTMRDERLMACGEMVCMSVVDAKRMIANKAAAGAWMDEAMNIIVYYRKALSQPEPLPAKK